MKLHRIIGADSTPGKWMLNFNGSWKPDYGSDPFIKDMEQFNLSIRRSDDMPKVILKTPGFVESKPK